MGQCDSVSVTSNDSQKIDPYMRAIQAQAVAQLERLPPGVSEMGIRLLQKLSPPQWTLEWYLPKWLGDAYALESTTTDALVLANLYGLAFIVLQDRIADDGWDGDESVQAICLGTALHHLWIRQYVQVFVPSSPFWRYFDGYMQEWIEATAASNRFPDQAFALAMQQSIPLLAGRAAPLKTCCAAACILSEQNELITALAAALDHLHVAAVLLDHVHDWRQDLAAGRYNIFVHFVSDAPQVCANYALNRQRVYERLLLQDAAQPYFTLAADHMSTAIARARNPVSAPRWLPRLV